MGEEGTADFVVAALEETLVDMGEGNKEVEGGEGSLPAIGDPG